MFCADTLHFLGCLLVSCSISLQQKEHKIQLRSLILYSFFHLLKCHSHIKHRQCFFEENEDLSSNVPTGNVLTETFIVKYYLVFLFPVRGYFTKPGENGGWDQGRSSRKGNRWANLRKIQEIEVTLGYGDEGGFKPKFQLGLLVGWRWDTGKEIVILFCGSR